MTPEEALLQRLIDTEPRYRDRFVRVNRDNGLAALCQVCRQDVYAEPSASSLEQSQVWPEESSSQRWDRALTAHLDACRGHQGQEQD